MRYPLVTVFGGSGFLGRHLIRRLAQHGYRIRVAVRRPNLAGFLLPLGKVGQILPVQANIRDDASTLRAMTDAEIVVNLVGIRGPSGPQTLGNVNAQGPRRIGRLARTAGIKRVLHVSTIDAAPDARSHFARAKSHGERFLREDYPEAVIVRPSILFGREDYFFNGIASAARFTPVIPVVEGDQVRIQPVYVGDVAEAMTRILDDPTTDGQTYEFAGPQVFTLRETVEMVLRYTGRRRLVVPVPFNAALGAGLVLQYLPGRVLAADDVRQWTSTRVASGASPGLQDLGVSPSAAEVMLPPYLVRFRPAGQGDFSEHSAPHL